MTWLRHSVMTRWVKTQELWAAARKMRRLRAGMRKNETSFGSNG